MFLILKMKDHRFQQDIKIEKLIKEKQKDLCFGFFDVKNAYYSLNL